MIQYAHFMIYDTVCPTGRKQIQRTSPEKKETKSIFSLYSPLKHDKIKSKFYFCLYFLRNEGVRMPKVAYSEEEREKIRTALLTAGLELMAKQGIQRTTVEQIYKKVGISRTFFYSYFPTKEDFIVEMLYLQQPKIIAYAQQLMADPELNWRQAVERFLHSCCYGEQNGIAVLTIEEQQLLFRRLSKESYEIFRQKQACLFGRILEAFGVQADRASISLFTNLSLAVLVLRKAIPDALPLFVPEAADETTAFQVRAIVDALEILKEENRCQDRPDM